jgi:hypothetical protein
MKNYFFPFKAKISILSIVICIFLSGCETIPKKSLYPSLTEGTPVSILFIDNPFSSNMWLATTPFLMQMGVDGFTLHKKEYLPTGVSEFRLFAGSHQITIKVQTCSSLCYTNPVTINVEMQAGETYRILFKKIGSFIKPKVQIIYEGWSEEDSSSWPTEIGIANPIFG